MKVNIINELNSLPKYQTAESAGMDLMANIKKPTILKSGERLIIPTGIKLVIPTGYEGQIRPRSGLAVKHGVTVLTTPGTIDADFIDEIMVILINLGGEDFTIIPEMRIAQIVFNKFEKVELINVKEFSKEEKQIDRGGGLGSTDKPKRKPRGKKSNNNGLKA
jgi:dUTP pyrophosphatase